MEFLKSLVPGAMSAEGPVEHRGGLPRETGPRLLRMRRLSLLAMGQAIEEVPAEPVRWNRTGVKGTAAPR